MAAGGTKGIKAGRAYVELGTDNRVAAGLQKAKARLKAFGAGVAQIGASMAKVGGIIAGAFLAAAKTFASMGDRIGKMAKRTGMSVEALSALEFAASQSGSSITDLETGIKRMQRTLYDAERGLSTATDALRDLGLSSDQFKGVSPEGQFRLVAEALSKVEDPSRRAALALTIFGRAGTGLLPMVAQGAKGLDALIAEAERLGLVMRTADAAAAEKFTDDMDKMWRTVKMGVFRIGQQLVPLFTDLAETIRQAAVDVGAFVQRHRTLVTTVAKAALVMLALGVGLMVAGKAIRIVATLLGVAATAAKVVGVAFTFLAAHPVVAMLLAIAAAGAAVIAIVHSLTSKTAELSDRMQTLRERGDELRAADMKRMDRLRALAKEERLNNEQTKEASDLIDTLTDRYGDLGIQLDKTTGKLTGVADAQASVNKLMAAAALAQLTNEIAEYQRNIEALREEMRSATFGVLFTDIAGKEEEILVLLGKIKVASLRLKAIRAGARSPEDLTGKPGPGAPGPIVDAAAAAALIAGRAKLERELHRMRLENIKNEFDRERALINETYRHKIKATKDAATAAILESQRQERIDQLEQRQHTAEDTARKDAAKALADEQKKAADDRAAHEQDLDRQIAVAKIEATMKGEKRERALHKLRRDWAIADAKALGLNVEKVRRLWFLRGQLMTRGPTAERAVTARGTFSAAGLRGLLGGGSAAQITAENTGKIAKSTEKMARCLAAGNLALAFQ